MTNKLALKGQQIRDRTQLPACVLDRPQCVLSAIRRVEAKCRDAQPRRSRQSFRGDPQSTRYPLSYSAVMLADLAMGQTLISAYAFTAWSLAANMGFNNSFRNPSTVPNCGPLGNRTTLVEHDRSKSL